MSWKLAELRWRHDVGLNEKPWERDEEDGGQSQVKGTTSIRTRETQRARCYTAPLCRVVEQDDPSENSLHQAVRSHPRSLALYSRPSENSTTPLLKRRQSEINIITDQHHPIRFSEKDIKESDLSINKVRTPPQPTSFPCETLPCPQFDGVRGFLLPVEDTPTSPEPRTPSVVLSRKSEAYQTREYPTTPADLFPAGLQPASVSPFEFEFPRTPSFGLHFSQHSRSYEERDVYVLKSGRASLWARSPSFSPTYRRSSLDSTHHSDSALLQNVSMDNQTSHSSPDRRATRPLYPDLTSAHADIQGRRTASLQQPSSSRSGTRFPLSPSSSSSDEEMPVTLSLDNDGIPLRNLPCRKVHSAHIVLHEADDHPESSAIFETSDENTDPKRRKSRASTTLEDIVSQYADASPSRSPSHGLRTYLGTTFGVQRPATGSEEVVASNADPFHGEPARLSTPVSPNEVYQLYQQRDDSATFPSPGNDEVVDEEAWATVPESSRTGFFTPSKLRFRLRKRKTGETSTSGVTGRSPTSPWDPLSESAQPKHARPRPQIRQKGHQNFSHNQSSPGQHRHGDTSAKGKHTSTRYPQSADTRGQASDTVKQHWKSAGFPTDSHIRPLTMKSRPATRISSTHAESQSHPKHSSTQSTSHALASSSLLPKVLENLLVPNPTSPTTMNTTVKLPRAGAGDTIFELSSVNEGQNNANKAGTESFIPELPPQTTSRNTRDQLGASPLVIDSFMTFGKGTPRFNPARYGSSNIRTIDATQNETLLAQHLYEGGYSLNDGDLSRFLRDSRRLRHGLETGEEFVLKHDLFGQRSVHITGSSLANLSSVSSTVSHLHLANTSSSDSHYSQDDNSNAATMRPMRNIIQCLTTTGKSTEEQQPGYSSLGGAHASAAGVSGRAFLVCNEVAISVDGREVQRRAGVLLLAFGVLAYLPGGWTLIHSMGKGGPLATTAMAELTRVLEGEEKGVVCCVHPEDAAMARAIERAAVVLVLVVAVCWLGAAWWSAVTF